MLVARQPVTDDEIARLGHEVYDRVVTPKLRPEDHGRFVMVDVLS